LFLKSAQPLILASTSLYRRELLGRLGVPFSTQAPNIDESRLPGEDPAVLVTRLARAKALKIAESSPGWVIGSDQAAVLGDTVLGKPGDHPRCVEQLTAASGQRVRFLTAVALLNRAVPAPLTFVDITWVKFRSLDPASIERYVDRERPFDCAGGFKCEGLGISLFDTIETSDPTALVGLPLIAVSRLLREAGYLVP